MKMPGSWKGPNADDWTWVGQQDGDLGINVNTEIGDDDGDPWDMPLPGTSPETGVFRQNPRRHHRDQEGA